MEIQTSRDFVKFISETMDGVKKGDVTPSAGNAVANLGGKLLQMIALEMKIVNAPKLASRRSIQIEAD